MLNEMKRLLTVLLLGGCMALSAQNVISLEGAWDFAVGERAGSTHAQLMPPTVYSDYVMLPGSMLTNGKGDAVSVNTPWTGSLYDSSYYFNPYMEKYRHEGRMKFPFFLTPERHFVGLAWYHRSIYVPEQWKDQRVTLFLERPHIETTVFINGTEVGHQMSLSVPHRYDVTRYIKVGAKNQIAIGVYNGIENVCVGQDSHSVTDQTQGNWNGIVGRIELQSQWKKLSVKHVSVRLDSAYTGRVTGRGKHKIRHREPAAIVTVEIEDNMSTLSLWDYYVEATLSSMADGQPVRKIAGNVEMAKNAKDGKIVFEFFTKGMLKLWDEYHPNLYMLTIDAGDDLIEMPIGLRRVGVKGRQLTINDRPLFLRGTVENCCFPETGYPPTDEQEWLRIFRKCKDYGLNHVRFHSYCPPEAAFAAADKVGIYLQPEGPSWPNHGVRLRRGQTIDQYLLEESKRIVDEYGHHPSFIMMAAGNEPAGDWVSYCNDWVKAMKAYDPTRIYAGASVGGGWAWDDGSEFHVKGGARGLDWDSSAPSSADDYYAQIEFPRNYKASEPNNSPIIAHEQGQWCAFPDLKDTTHYTGVYKARNFEIFSDLLRDGGMAGMAEKFLMASGNLQTLCYKYEIERNLRTPDYAGFQLLGLNDYSGQGTALVGPLNVHWNEKGYTNAQQWREFCGPLVLQARFPKFVFSDSDTLRVPIEAYNAYYCTLTESRPVYYVADDSARVYGGGTLSRDDLPVAKNISLGTVVMPLDSIKRATKLTLTVKFSDRLKNHWDFWVYPRESCKDCGDGDVMPSEVDKVRSVFITADWHEALAALKSGKTVLLTAAGKVTLGSDVVQHYLPVFWNTSWFKMRPPHTTGAYINASHPLFRHDFPTDSWSNLNWWELLNRAQVMNLRELPADYQSPIQPIDTWHVSRKLGMIVETKVGKGRLLMTTMDISNDLGRRIVARQMRHAIIDYMQSSDFNPSMTLKADVVEHFFTEHAPAVNMFTNDSPDELKPKLTNN